MNSSIWLLNMVCLYPAGFLKSIQNRIENKNTKKVRKRIPTQGNELLNIVIALLASLDQGWMLILARYFLQGTHNFTIPILNMQHLSSTF